MIETVTGLVAILVSVNTWMRTFEAGRSWALQVSYKLTSAQLDANRPACCIWLRDAAGNVYRTDTGLVYLINLEH